VREAYFKKYSNLFQLIIFIELLNFYFNKLLKQLKTHILLVLTFLGVVVGFALGLSLRSAKLNEETIMLISFPGDILMRMLKMCILPLIVSSLVTGMCFLNNFLIKIFLIKIIKN
jgi:Na+/H+-dicarboxylate symporter